MSDAVAVEAPWASEVFLRPRAWSNLIRDEQGKYRYCLMSTGARGIHFPDRTAYACEPITDANRAEADEVRREAEEAMRRAMGVLVSEYERVAREQGATR